MTSITDFAKVMAFISAATQKPASPETVEVYYDLLGDLDLEVLKSAAKRVVLEHPWATLPSVAELRQAAVQTTLDKTQTISAQEAWSIAWRAAGQIDPDIKGEFVTFDGHGNKIVHRSMTDYALQDVPPHVRRTMQLFGMGRLIAGNEPLGVMQAQFCQTYSALQLEARREALLPLSLRNEMDRLRSKNEGEERERQIRDQIGNELENKMRRIGVE